MIFAEFCQQKYSAGMSEILAMAVRCGPHTIDQAMELQIGSIQFRAQTTLVYPKCGRLDVGHPTARLLLFNFS